MATTSGVQRYMAGYNAGRTISVQTGSTESGRLWLAEHRDADAAFVAGYEWALWDYDDAQGFVQQRRPGSAS